jgi:putative transposase
LEHVVQIGKSSQRRACRLLKIHRTVARYRIHPADDSVLRSRLKAMAAEYPRYDCEMLHPMLKGEGLVINLKRTYRIYKEENLQVRRKRRKRLAARDRMPMPVPDRGNQRWSRDFVSDQLATGLTFR